MELRVCLHLVALSHFLSLVSALRLESLQLSNARGRTAIRAREGIVNGSRFGNGMRGLESHKTGFQFHFCYRYNYTIVVAFSFNTNRVGGLGSGWDGLRRAK